MNTLSFLERFFSWLLQTTWQAAVIVFLILLVQLIFRNRLSASWRHGLWFLLMIRLVLRGALLFLSIVLCIPCLGIDLLERYPTQLTDGDTNPDHARAWEFGEDDIYSLADFKLGVGQKLEIQCGLATVGIGHCQDGAVWAVVVPKETSSLTCDEFKEPERFNHLWLRFHPQEVTTLFPLSTVITGMNKNLLSRMRAIAGERIYSSFHASGKAMIPKRNEIVADLDTAAGVRRVFLLDTTKQSVEYVSNFEKKAMKLPPAVTPDAMAQAFDILWERFDRNYAMFVLRPDVDWAKLREEKRPQALACTSVYEFADVCASLLRPLRDLHIWLTVAGTEIPVYNRPRSSNSNPSAHELILGPLHKEGKRVFWTETTNQIGYLRIDLWDDEEIPTQCSKVLENFRNTRGMIVDVRLNGGGSENFAMDVASRFIKEKVTYAFDQFRNGPNHTNLTEKLPRELSPQGPWRYDRPVVVLIGQKCMSSNESFAAMMSKDPDAILMGDHTCGSSGNPTIINLPLDMTVSVPQWIDYLPDGSLLDEVGVKPQIQFVPQPDSFSGKRDDLLTAALNRLSTVPLPPKPIEGKPYLSAEEMESADTTRPHVVSLFPQDGSTMVDTRIMLRVRFDRPMDPFSLKLDWQEGGFASFDFPRYDAERYEFTIPVTLIPGTVHRIAINDVVDRPHLESVREIYRHDGFQSSDKKLAAWGMWKFETGKVKGDGPKPKVLKVSPPPGAGIPSRSTVEVVFDQSMQAPDLGLPYIMRSSGADEVSSICFIQYDPSLHSMRIPVVLLPGKQRDFTLAGFYSASGQPSDPINLSYYPGGKETWLEEHSKSDGAAVDSPLIAILTRMQGLRSQMTTLSETVQTLSAQMLGPSKDRFTHLESHPANFYWHSPNQYFSDVTDMISCQVFEIGNDGKKWWWHYADATQTNLECCPQSDVREFNSSLCDPFGLRRRTPAEAAKQLGLLYLGSDGGFDRFAAWKTQLNQNDIYATYTEWVIDPNTAMPSEVLGFDSAGMTRSRFFYHQTSPEALFKIPTTRPAQNVSASALEQGYDHRFVDMSDGSDGTIRLRWGQRGKKGTLGSGLN